jgi:uncharacterized membrane protein (UPF0182 family)
MSYQEKRSVVGIVAGVLLLAAYCIYAFGRASDFHNLKFFAVTMLVFIAIGIAAMIVIQIVFHILLSISIAVKEKIRDDKEIEKEIEATFVTDEMDKLIELKAGRVGLVFAGAGFIAGLLALVFNCPPAVMLNILFLSGGAGTLASGALSIRYYRAGIR